MPLKDTILLCYPKFRKRSKSFVCGTSTRGKHSKRDGAGEYRSNSPRLPRNRPHASCRPSRTRCVLAPANWCVPLRRGFIIRISLWGGSPPPLERYSRLASARAPMSFGLPLVRFHHFMSRRRFRVALEFLTCLISVTRG